MPPTEDDNRPPDLSGRTVFHQTWPIVGGTLMVQIRTNRVLLGGEFIEVGKVMAEIERLAEMLSDQSEADDAEGRDPPEEPPPR